MIIRKPINRVGITFKVVAGTPVDPTSKRYGISEIMENMDRLIKYLLIVSDLFEEIALYVFVAIKNANNGKAHRPNVTKMFWYSGNTYRK